MRVYRESLFSYQAEDPKTIDPLAGYFGRGFPDHGGVPSEVNFKALRLDQFLNHLLNM